MKKINKKYLRFGLRRKLIGGIILVSVLLCSITCIFGYQCFTHMYEQQYNSMAYYIADTALSYVNGDSLDKYLSTGETDDAFWECQDKLDTLVVTTDATLVYVAAVDPTDYMTLSYVYDSVHPSTGFDRYPLGYTAKDIDPQYVDSVRTLMTEGERSAQYFYSNNEESGAHTTAAVAVYNSAGEIVGMLAVEKAMTDLYQARMNYIYVVVAITFFAVVLFILLYSRYLDKYTIKPILSIAEEARYFTKNNGQVSEVLTQIKSNDEIGTLATAVHKTQVDIQTYIKDLTAVTAEKERIGAELDVAKQIQASMLPCIFPAFPERPELDIYATMIPAKEVGGDFYDFFLIDDDHLGMVMADVSGKGVPAALFMVIAKTLLKNVAQTGLSPKAVLEKVNKQLCAGNEAEMFVTVWLGILEISTGKLACGNAGHEYPVLKRVNGDYTLLKDKHGFVLAGMEHSRYTEYALQMNPGDRIFLYTDGVPEATNANDELYGTDRMLDTLNRSKECDCKRLLTAIKEDVDNFVGQAPQFDDITMLCLTLMPADTFGMQKLKLPPSLEAMTEVTNFVEQSMEEAALPMKLIAQMNIAVDEIFSNIARYSGATDATVGVKISNGCLTLRFADNGLPYDPTATAVPDTSLSVDEREIGGLGLLMVKKFMDTVEYEYHDGLNILTLKKQIRESVD